MGLDIEKHGALISVSVIPEEQMRYNTEGDWRAGPNGEIIIEIVDGMPRREAMLLALHELVEAMLCEAAGVTQQQVDDFDMAFAGDGEPGDDPAAPYRRQHRFAALIDHMVAHEMGLDGYGRVDWETTG